MADEADASVSAEADMALLAAIAGLEDPCNPAAALESTRSVSPDGLRARMLLAEGIEPPDVAIMCLGVIAYLDGTSSEPLQQRAAHAQDNSAPRVLSMILQSEAGFKVVYAAGKRLPAVEDAAVDSAVKVFFSKRLMESSVNRNTITLSDSKGAIGSEIKYDDDWMMASIAPEDGLEEGKTYDVKVSPSAAKAVRAATGQPMLTRMTKSFATIGAAWPPCDAGGKGALPSCEVFFGAFDKEALKCVPYEGADPGQAPNGGVGYSYDGLTLMGFFSKDPDPAAALACFVSQASSAQHRAEILAGCVPLDHVLSSFGTCEMPKLGLSSESVELSCTAGRSCNTAQVTVTNGGSRTLVW
ncbi:MAG TPA: Ig-like domain-containing protein, partial [Spirochaetales bacterium]|nr:Ig-like domain-containing protein [Spirochaetales bacterium]